jgi:iron complex outermembrane receptor protein
VTLAKRNADFKLEKSEAIEAGVKQTVNDVFDYTLSLYRIVKRDLVTRDPEDPSRNLQIGRQASQGMELAWGAQLTPSLTWLGNVALLRARFEKFFVADEDGAVSYKGKKPINVPEKIANTWLSYKAGPLTTLAGVRHVGEQQGDLDNSYTFDAYSLVQASVTYAWEGYELTLRGKNLTDERYAAWNAGGDMVLIGEPASYEVSLYTRF